MEVNWFCQMLRNKVERGRSKTVIFSNESHIYLDGFTNKQNFRMCIRTKPLGVCEKHLHSSKVTAKRGFSFNGVFQDPGLNALTVTSDT